MGFKSLFQRLKVVFRVAPSQNAPPNPKPKKQKKPKRPPPASASPNPEITITAPTPTHAQPPKSPLVRPKYNPEECTFAKLQGKTVAKAPGQITSDTPFTIEDCEDSNIFILTPTAQVTIDCVKRCFIFIAPCDGSVFIRDAEECTFVVASRQFRVRDARALHISLYAATQPVIETSRHVRFSCFRYVYAGLADQFAGTKLPLLLNEWSNIYDFSATKGDNWALEPQLDPTTYPAPPPDTVTPDWDAPNVVPHTLGALPRSKNGSMILLSFTTPSTTAEMLRRLRGHITIVQIRERAYSESDVPLLFGHITDTDVLRLVKQKGRCIAAELEGTETNALLLLENSRPPLADLHCIYFSRSRESASKELRLFFGG
ncbi:hypothetical protein PhCBS80983_g01775 [Powellomyces hirtus]|uniref:C-CAP/cofactor C-like domain-containing protein n=1 Tax=Powellomyces hirtus TaxID=109895 RepID=A0A507E8P2_9FUNG|nr:hypothetical protein PhCBS80983_g01775 [Powellomyces hirtus]